MLKADSIEVGSDNDVNVRGVRLARAVGYRDDATVTLALYASKANALAETSAITGTAASASYVTGSNGNYLGVIADDQTAGLTIDTVYWLGVKIVIDGRTRRFAIPYTARAASN